MKISLDAIFNVDRRIVFIFVFLSILAPLLFPFSMPIRPTEHVITAYGCVQSAAENNKLVLLSFDFDPTGKAEQEPMARAIVRHIFARGGKVVVLGGTLTGQGLHEQILAECAQEFGKVQGDSYVYFPWKAGAGNTLVINMAQNFASAYPEAKDYPLTRDIVSLRDFDYAVIFPTGLGFVVNWINFAQGPCGLKLGAAVSGQMAPDLYNYVNSGQLTGLLGGLVGAAEYEQLLKDSGLVLLRRFSAADMPALTMRGLCEKLTAAGRSPLMARIWSNLPDEPRAAVRRTLDAGYDRTSPADKKALAAAMNRAATQPDAIPPADLDTLKIETATAALLANNPTVRARADEVRRRLFVEKAFGTCLLPAQSPGQATQWMTPQSITHLMLIVALLVGNACYLWDRRRRRKGSSGMRTDTLKRDLLLIGAFLAAMIVIDVVLVLTGRLAWGGWWNWQSFGIMVAAALTLALFSQLYNDNPLFKAAEHIFVGTSVAYGLGVAWYNMWVSEIFKGLKTGAPEQQLGVWSIILPSILGLLIYARLTKRFNWVSRWPFALMIGFGVGYAIPTQIAGNLLKQIEPMMVNVLRDSSGHFGPNWDAIVILAGVLSTLVYFFFSLEHKGAVGQVSKVGVWFLMISFGASFGYTVMGRLSLLIGRIDFLFRDWIPLIK